MRRIWNVLIDIPRQLKRLGPKRTRAVTERPPAEEAGKPQEPQPPAEALPSQEIPPKAEEPKNPEEPPPAPRLPWLKEPHHLRTRWSEENRPLYAGVTRLPGGCFCF
jgi:hypothetical protein